MKKWKHDPMGAKAKRGLLASEIRRVEGDLQQDDNQVMENGKSICEYWNLTCSE
jgi:hypothetical protein